MTRQEMFNRAYQGVIGQGALAKDGGGCSYRTPTGLRCAASWLLTDEQLEKVVHGSNYLTFGVVARSLGILREEWLFAERLQAAHDSAETLNEFRAQMEHLAEDVGLQVPS